MYTMTGQGPRAERETVIRFVEDDDLASVWTASEVVYRRLIKRLGRAYLTEDGERHAIFEFPRKWLNLPRLKQPRKSNPTVMSKMRSKIGKAL